MKHLSIIGRRARVVAASAVVAVMALLAACTSAQGPSAAKTASVHAGGVLRLSGSSLEFSDNMDPTGEYSSWGELNLQVRTLVTYKYATGAAGLQIVPDIATTVPKPTDNGLTYTFHLKSGVRFAPPVNRAVTSYDFAYAFERINLGALAAQYGFYFDGVIKGMTGSAKSLAPISGISTPNASTIVFHLTKPTGDFLDRLAMYAAGPIPSQVAKCFLTPGSYGRDLVSSGPYMLLGSDKVNISSCSTIKPVSGFDPTRGMVLVRNPNYSQKTDQQTGRKNYPNAVTISVDSNVSDIYAKIKNGTVDADYTDTAPPPKAVLAQYLTNPSLRQYVHTTQLAGVTEYLAMNLTTPPFDDIHVRKAVNWILDKSAILKAWGGTATATIATHLIPPSVLGDVPQSNFNLYPTPGNAGSLAKAQAEMKQSRYDPLHDGKCDIAKDCNQIVVINGNMPPWTDIEPTVVSDLAKIGIHIVPRELAGDATFSAIQVPKDKIPAQMGVEWAYDYPDGLPYYNSLLDSSSINAQANENFSLVGLTPQTARSLGVSYPAGGIPSLDSQINKCEAVAVGSTQRPVCWANLEKQTMSSVVPWAPLVWPSNIIIMSSDVTSAVFPPALDELFGNDAVANKLAVPTSLSQALQQVN